MIDIEAALSAGSQLVVCSVRRSFANPGNIWPPVDKLRIAEPVMTAAGACCPPQCRPAISLHGAEPIFTAQVVKEFKVRTVRLIHTESCRAGERYWQFARYLIIHRSSSGWSPARLDAWVLDQGRPLPCPGLIRADLSLPISGIM